MLMFQVDAFNSIKICLVFLLNDMIPSNQILKFNATYLSEYKKYMPTLSAGHYCLISKNQNTLRKHVTRAMERSFYKLLVIKIV